MSSGELMDMSSGNRPETTQAVETTETAAKVVMSYRVFEDLIKASSAVGDEVFLIIDNGVKVRQLDEAHIIMAVADVVDYYIKEFSYPFSDEKVLVVPVELLKQFKFKDYVDVVITIADTAKIEFITGDLKIERPLEIENIYRTYRNLQFDFAGYVDVEVDQLLQVLKTAGKIANYVVFEANGGYLNIIARGSSGEEFKYTRPSPEADNIRVAFSVIYLTNILKALKNVTDRVRVHLATNKPGAVEALDSKYVKAIYYIAPRDV